MKYSCVFVCLIDCNRGSYSINVFVHLVSIGATKTNFLTEHVDFFLGNKVFFSRKFYS